MSPLSEVCTGCKEIFLFLYPKGVEGGGGQSLGEISLKSRVFLLTPSLIGPHHEAIKYSTNEIKQPLEWLQCQLVVF